jgi:hypothetical protein
LVCVCKSIQLILPLFVINAPFSKHSKLLQLLVMPLVSSLSTISFLLFFFIFLSSLAFTHDGVTLNSILSFISCLSHMLVMTSHRTLSSFSFLSHLSHLQRWHCVPIMLCLSKLYHLLHLQRWRHVPFLLSFSTLSSFVSPLSFIFCTCNDGVTSPFYSLSTFLYSFLSSFAHASLDNASLSFLNYLWIQSSELACYWQWW